MATKSTKTTKAEKPAKTPKTEKAEETVATPKAAKTTKAAKAPKAEKAPKTTTKRKKKAEDAAEPEILTEAAALEPENETDDELADTEPAEIHDEEEPAEEALRAVAEAEDEAAEDVEPEAEPAEEEAAAEDEEDETAELPPSAAPKQERLQKILAQAGIASRRHAEELITGGHVQVNGQTVTVLGSKADPARDHIRVDGKLLQGAERLRYFMLHKPKGYVTTVSDPEGRPTVMEFFAKAGERLYPVGRLDYLSEGLLLVTNDGELANALTRAAAGVEKTYLVKVSGDPTEDALARLRGGVTIDKGKPGEGRVRTAPARVRHVREGDNPWFEVVLTEGRNRELRKMFEEIGHHVEKIRRVGYGPLVLDVPVGKIRPLDPEEVEALRLTAAGKLKPKRLKTKNMLPRDAGKTVVYEDAEEKPRGRKPFGERPARPGFGPKREGGSSPRREGGFAPRREGGFTPRREGGFAPRREGGFAPRADRPERREGGFAKREGGFAPKREGGFGQKREGGFGAKREGGFAPRREGGFAPRREGGFAPRADRPERREGSFAKREGGFGQKREGGFAPRREGGFGQKREGGSGPRREGGFGQKREGGFGARREGGFAPKREGGFARQDRPFRPTPDRGERPEGESRGFAPRGEEFRPKRGGNPRFGRPEGGRTGNRRDDRGFRPDDRPQQSFRPRPERRPFEIVEEGSGQPASFSRPAAKPFRPAEDRPFAKPAAKFGARPGAKSGPKFGGSKFGGPKSGGKFGPKPSGERREGGFRGKPKTGGKPGFGFKGKSGGAGGPKRGGFKPRPGGRPGGNRER